MNEEIQEMINSEKLNFKRLKDLIDQGADIHQVGRVSNYSLLELAASKGHLSCTKLLIESGAKVNGNEDDEGSAVTTPLHKAASNNRVGVVKLLVQNGANVNVMNEEGYTPLEEAVFYGNLDIVKFLINQANADFDSINHRQHGRTPLWEASHRGHLDIVWFLLEKGAHPNAKDKDGITPLMCAEQQNHNQIAYLLKQHDKTEKAREERLEFQKLLQQHQTKQDEQIKQMITTVLHKQTQSFQRQKQELQTIVHRLESTIQSLQQSSSSSSNNNNKQDDEATATANNGREEVISCNAEDRHKITQSNVARRPPAAAAGSGSSATRNHQHQFETVLQKQNKMLESFLQQQQQREKERHEQFVKQLESSLMERKQPPRVAPQRQQEQQNEQDVVFDGTKIHSANELRLVMDFVEQKIKVFPHPTLDMNHFMLWVGRAKMLAEVYKNGTLPSLEKLQQNTIKSLRSKRTLQGNFKQANDEQEEEYKKNQALHAQAKEAFEYRHFHLQRFVNVIGNRKEHIPTREHNNNAHH